MNIKKLNKQKTGLILSNGSEERIIELDYIESLNRIHDGIQLLET